MAENEKAAEVKFEEFATKFKCICNAESGDPWYKSVASAEVFSIGIIFNGNMTLLRWNRRNSVYFPVSL